MAALSARQKLRRMALASIAIAFVVMGLKYLAYHITGSVALFSDALESIVNVIPQLSACGRRSPVRPP
jgi:divalent metal cation (Fe/Co/Zn/Cd) transporter